MKGRWTRMWMFLLLATMLVASGCGTPDPNVERGPDGTIAYSVPITSSPSGARIEVSEQVVGVTPMTWKIYGDRDGTFHNFGFDQVILRAYPPGGGLSQSVVFQTGTISIHDDKIPRKIDFNFGSATNNSTKPPTNQ